MLPSFLSPVALYSSYLRRCFSAAGLSSQTLDIDDETTMHFWGPDPARSGTAAREKPSLVLIHGFGPVATWQWRRQVQFFAPKFDVYVPDLVFFGESTTRSAERTEGFQAAAVARLMERVGVKSYSLVGTSYGGMVAYNMARKWPERVEKVVIASSGVNMRLRDGVELLRRANLEKTEDLMLPATANQLRTLLRLAVFKQPNLMPEFFLNDFIDKLYSENRKEKMELLKGLTIGKDDEAKLPPLDKDVLIVWGDHDMIFPFEMATELKELLGKKARLEVMKNAGHVPQTENPAQFNEIVNNFLCFVGLCKCLQKLYSENRKEKMELLKGLTIGKDDEAKLPPLDKDVLIVWGDHDMIFPFEMATELKELLGKKARLEVMKNAGHVPQTENPAQFNEIVNNFLCEAS